MSYTRHPQQALGGIMDVARAASAIVEDPCLAPVTTLVLRLHAAEQPKAPRPATPGAPRPAPPPPAKGVGLCYAVTPLKALVWVRERPWVIPLGASAILGGLFLAGFATGRRTR